MVVAAANLLLIFLFPPYDYLSVQRGGVATFSGFHFALGALANHRLNENFLTLEILVVLINTAIAWLLLRPRPPGQGKVNRYQRSILWLVAVNLVLTLLFPPFENYTAISQAALPSFEGFYFVFGDNAQRQIVTPILYIEIALLLVNAGLFWLFFKNKGEERLSAGEIRNLAQQLQKAQTKNR